MTSMMKSVKTAAQRLHQDEQGAEGLEKLLIVAAIVLPLLGVLLLFSGAIQKWVTNAWTSMTGNANAIQTPNPQVP